MTKLETLLQAISEAFNQGSLQKLTLGGRRNKTGELRNVHVKLVTIKTEVKLSFVYRFATKDTTKNFSLEEAIPMLKDLLLGTFYNLDLYTAGQNYFYLADAEGKEKLVLKKGSGDLPVLLHDKEKNRVADAAAPYLRELGISGADGHVKKDMQHKYRQINRYIEIIDGILKDEASGAGFSVADMGSGKGYLTFALYDHLQKRWPAVQITGIELRKDLVAVCSKVAASAGYSGIYFKEGSIQDTVIGTADMLIALHACDTATDDAIAKGIHAGTKYIICAPCCHKQIRKQMAPANALNAITRHGILLERQAETVTDAIRALLLEANGYRTKVFEFIHEADTPKNVMIAAVKNMHGEISAGEKKAQVAALKQLFGIREHYLETLLVETGTNPG